LAALRFSTMVSSANGGAGTELEEGVQSALLVEVAQCAPGHVFDAGVRLVIPPGAHIYWRNPGDAGLPTELIWELPEGFRAGPMEWPVPKRFTDGELASFGYEGTVVFPVRLTPPPAWPTGRTARIRVRVSWLLCRDTCVPGSATLERELPVGTAPISAQPDAALLRQARRRLPSVAHEVRASFTADGERIRVRLSSLSTGHPTLLLPYDGAFLPAAATPRWVAGPEAGEWHADMPRAPAFPMPSSWFALLILDDGRGLELDIRPLGSSVNQR